MPPIIERNPISAQGAFGNPFLNVSLFSFALEKEEYWKTVILRKKMQVW